MRKTSLIYVIYIVSILSITIFLSIQILEGKVKTLPIFKKIYHLPLVGKIIMPISESKLEDQLIRSLEKFKETKKLCTSESKNSFGFKDYEWKIEKPNNTFRMLAFGDSLTYGYCVGMNDTWPKQLERKLNELNLSIKFEVLNLGSREYDRTYTEFQLFKTLGLPLNSDAVILQYTFNDWESPEILKKTQEKWQEYLKGEYKLPEEIEKEIKKLNINETGEGVSRLIAEIVLREYYKTVDPEKEWDRWVREPLIKWINLLRKKDIKFMLITWDMVYPHAWQKEKLKALSEEYNFGFYDFTKYIPMKHPSKIKFADNHLTPLGYEIVANKTLELILKNWIFCNFLEEKGYRNMCVKFKKDCELTSPKRLVQCVANKFVEDGYIEAAKKICLARETENIQIVCFARALAKINQNRALEECNLIEFEPERHHCRADILRFKNFEKAIKECEKINDTDWMNFCKASIYVLVDKKKVEDSCNSIVNLDRRNECKLFYIEWMKYK